MFEGKRYITNGIKNTVPEYLQNLLWYMIEVMEVSQKDYLQVFKLEEFEDHKQPKQKITHIQEQPEYTKVHTITTKSGINAKIFVIDDGDHSTMLLAEEY